MQTSYLIEHAFELRFALSVLTIVSLFALVRFAYFIDDKLTALASRKGETAPHRPSVAAATR